MKTEKELEESHGYALETPNKESGEELITQVEDTPFSVVNMDGRYFICMGKYRLSENEFESKTEAIKQARKINWNRILQVCMVINQLNEKK